jgi:hypothetical protein
MFSTFGTVRHSPAQVEHHKTPAAEAFLSLCSTVLLKEIKSAMPRERGTPSMPRGRSIAIWPAKAEQRSKPLIRFKKECSG